MLVLLYSTDEYDTSMAIQMEIRCSSTRSGIEASYNGSLLMSWCGCTVVLCMYVLEFYQGVVSSIVGCRILLPYAVGQNPV